MSLPEQGRRLRRRLRAVGRRYREARLVARAFQSDRHPILAQIVPMRRCNLSCAYCTEYDKTSAPVPLGEMLRRVDRLAALGTTSVQISGGEPLMPGGMAGWACRSAGGRSPTT